MTQATKLSEVDNGELAAWEYTPGSTAAQTEDFFNKYLASYLKYSKTEIKQTFDGLEMADKFFVYLNDGSYFYIHGGSCVDIDYDINGAKPPNESGRDIFVFLICFGDEVVKLKTYYVYHRDDTRETALDNCTQLHYTCSRLLEMDNWEFKDDYPYKL
jgi:hypothetical protein